MKYVTRPAPPPPGAGSSTTSSSSVSSNITSISSQMAKPKPPRPPPPRALPASSSTENIKASSKDQHKKIFSNLFGGRKAKTNATSLQQNTAEVKLPPPRIPAPPAAFVASSRQTTQLHHQPVYSSDVQLINFNESPPASPVGFIKKSNTGGSDSVSIDSFCSTNSSPHNFNSGTQSQAESGFEDDFNSVSDFKLASRAASRSTTFSNDPFDCLDDFPAVSSSSSIAGSTSVKNTVHIRNMKPMIQPKPVVSIGSTTNFYATSSSSAAASSSSIAPSPLNFGDDITKNVKPSMPTIIKPSSMGTRKPSPIHVPSPTPSVLNELKKPIVGPSSNYKELDATSDESFEDEPSSPPMPTIPAPVLVLNDENIDVVNHDVVEDEDEDEEKDSYGIALYDFESDVTEDLNFRANEKIYLIKQMNDEWMYGRNRRGCEGIFPINYVDIRVPLKNYPETDSGTASRSESVSPAAAGHRVRVLYTFIAEAEGDLTINENEFVNVMYEINGEWLYGSNTLGEYGQFPANFLEFVPQNLQQMPKY